MIVVFGVREVGYHGFAGCESVKILGFMDVGDCTGDAVCAILMSSDWTLWLGGRARISIAPQCSYNVVGLARMGVLGLVSFSRIGGPS